MLAYFYCLFLFAGCSETEVEINPTWTYGLVDGNGEIFSCDWRHINLHARGDACWFEPWLSLNILDYGRVRSISDGDEMVVNSDTIVLGGALNSNGYTQIRVNGELIQHKNPYPHHLIPPSEAIAQFQTGNIRLLPGVNVVTAINVVEGRFAPGGLIPTGDEEAILYSDCLTKTVYLILEE